MYTVTCIKNEKIARGIDTGRQTKHEVISALKINSGKLETWPQDREDFRLKGDECPKRFDRIS